MDCFDLTTILINTINNYQSILVSLKIMVVSLIQNILLFVWQYFCPQVQYFFFCSTNNIFLNGAKKTTSRDFFFVWFNYQTSIIYYFANCHDFFRFDLVEEGAIFRHILNVTDFNDWRLRFRVLGRDIGEINKTNMSCNILFSNEVLTEFSKMFFLNESIVWFLNAFFMTFVFLLLWNLLI